MGRRWRGTVEGSASPAIEPTVLSPASAGAACVPPWPFRHLLSSSLFVESCSNHCKAGGQPHDVARVRKLCRRWCTITVTDPRPYTSPPHKRSLASSHRPARNIERPTQPSKRSHSTQPQRQRTTGRAMQRLHEIHSRHRPANSDATDLYCHLCREARSRMPGSGSPVVVFGMCASVRSQGTVLKALSVRQTRPAINQHHPPRPAEGK